jgi:hypothetical protein
MLHEFDDERLRAQLHDDEFLLLSMALLFGCLGELQALLDLFAAAVSQFIFPMDLNGSNRLLPEVFRIQVQIIAFLIEFPLREQRVIAPTPPGLNTLERHSRI